MACLDWTDCQPLPHQVGRRRTGKGHCAHVSDLIVRVQLQVMAMVQLGAPPISCIMNTFVAICAYIKNGGW